MTVIFDCAEINDTLIEISQDKFETAFVVNVYRKRGNEYGFPEKHNIYDTLQKATKRYNYLKRQAVKGNL